MERSPAATITAIDAALRKVRALGYPEIVVTLDPRDYADVLAVRSEAVKAGKANPLSNTYRGHPIETRETTASQVLARTPHGWEGFAVVR